VARQCSGHARDRKPILLPQTKAPIVPSELVNDSKLHLARYAALSFNFRQTNGSRLHSIPLQMLSKAML
jgi:hypothetical protein